MIKNSGVFVFEGDSVTDAGRGASVTDAGRANEGRKANSQLGHGYAMMAASELLRRYPAPTPPNWWGSYVCSEIQKAKLVARLTTAHTALGVGSFFCETWSNYYPLDLSLLRRSFAADPVSPQQPQAAYYVMRNLATALADLQPAELECRLVGGPSSVEMFAMSRAGEQVVTLWQQGRAADVCLGTPADLLVAGRYRRAIGYDPLNGVEQELHAESFDGLLLWNHQP